MYFPYGPVPKPPKAIEKFKKAEKTEPVESVGKKVFRLQTQVELLAAWLRRMTKYVKDEYIDPSPVLDPHDYPKKKEIADWIKMVNSKADAFEKSKGELVK